MKDNDSVASYYDRNTRRFLRWGHGRGGQVIHRAVWGPRVLTRQDAIHYCHDLILAEIDNHQVVFLVDLGCGVGGSLAYLADRSETPMVGITLSSLQAQLGTRLIKDRGLDSRVMIIQGSYTDHDLLAKIVSGRQRERTAFYAIESLVHAEAPEDFFATVSSAATPGDLLILCDDFLRDDEARGDDRIGQFRDGWRTGPLLTSAGRDRVAGAHGFRPIAQTDLSGYLELGRPRDRLIRLLVRLTGFLPRRSAYWGNLVGGNALQLALEAGLLRYEFVVMERL